MATVALDGHLVASRPDAERVLHVSQLLPEVLLRLDPRVRSVFEEWKRRCAEGEARGDHQRDDDVDRFIREDCRQFTTLVRDLGLSSYRWLPQGLLWEFGRAFGVEVEETLPPDGVGDAWAERGRRPKKGSTHSEDLEQGIVWFYRTQIQKPRASVKGIAREYARDHGISEARSYVTNSIRRVKTLLAAINPPKLDPI